MAGQSLPWKANYAFSEKLWIRPKTWFLTHNFGYRYASKSIQGSINVDFDLVFNRTLTKRVGQTVGSRAGQRRPKFLNHAFFVTSPPEIPPLKTKNVFFLFWLQDLLNPSMVWIALQLNRLASYRIAELCKIWGVWGTERVKEVGGTVRDQGRSRGQHKCLSWIVIFCSFLKLNLLWLTLSNPT